MPGLDGWGVEADKQGDARRSTTGSGRPRLVQCSSSESGTRSLAGMEGFRVVHDSETEVHSDRLFASERICTPPTGNGSCDPTPPSSCGRAILCRSRAK
jgi:hypothetical protein